MKRRTMSDVDRTADDWLRNVEGVRRDQKGEIRQVNATGRKFSKYPNLRQSQFGKTCRFCVLADLLSNANQSADSLTTRFVLPRLR